MNDALLIFLSLTQQSQQNIITKLFVSGVKKKCFSFPQDAREANGAVLGGGAVVRYSVYICDDGGGEVWFPVWSMTQQLLPALTLVPRYF